MAAAICFFPEAPPLGIGGLLGCALGVVELLGPVLVEVLGTWDELGCEIGCWGGV